MLLESLQIQGEPSAAQVPRLYDPASAAPPALSS
jgi:hypothetical protein